MPVAASITVEVPRVLRAYCGGAAQLALAAHTVKEALEELERQHPDLYRSVCDETGAVRRHVNVFINTLHMRDRNGVNSELNAGDVLIILPAVSGG